MRRFIIILLAIIPFFGRVQSQVDPQSKGKLIIIWGGEIVLIYDQWHWQQQAKDLGRVYVPFRMISSGGSYSLHKHEMLRKLPAE